MLINIYIVGKTFISSLGLDPVSIYQTVTGRAKATYGCKWESIPLIEAEELQRGPTKEQLNFLRDN